MTFPEGGNEWTRFIQMKKIKGRNLQIVNKKYLSWPMPFLILRHSFQSTMNGIIY